jgi:hypothetical protein
VTNITIEPDVTYTRGMKSKLSPAKFDIKEGEFYSAYARNMLTRSNTPSNIDLINGDALRGYYLKHQMTNSSTTETWLMDAEIEYDISNK